MKHLKSALITTCVFFSLIFPFTSRAELLDQGLKSVMDIIDTALLNIDKPDDTDKPQTPEEKAAAGTTVINLSRTLGTLSYSRLQCGEAEVLAAFTQRVQKASEDIQDKMRTAFQTGFDKSKESSTLLSEDECVRLTKSRNFTEEVNETNMAEEKAVAVEEPKAEVIVEVIDEDPKLHHIRLAKLSGQLAYKHSFCSGNRVFNRDYNSFIKTVPEAFQSEVKDAYWSGFKHGKRINKYLTREQC